MIEQNSKRLSSRWVNFASCILAAAFVAALVWFASGVRGFYKTMRVPSLNHETFDSNQIQAWMTFHYVDFVFHLPAGYLAMKLQVPNPVYPNETLGAYARANGIDAAVFVRSVKGVVSSYQPGNTVQ